MSDEEFKALGEKIAKGDSIPEDRLEFLKELNLELSGLNEDLVKLEI